MNKENLMAGIEDPELYALTKRELIIKLKATLESNKYLSGHIKVQAEEKAKLLAENKKIDDARKHLVNELRNAEQQRTSLAIALGILSNTIANIPSSLK